MFSIADRQAILSGVGEIIRSIKVAQNTITIKFKNNKGLVIRDDGQHCCESRYMEAQDNVEDYIGAEFRDFTILGCEYKDEPDRDVLEIQFAKIITSKGNLKFANYNSHNGYYGGFDVTVKEI